MKFCVPKSFCLGWVPLRAVSHPPVAHLVCCLCDVLGRDTTACLPCFWAAQYNTWLLIKLTPKGIVFLLFSSLLFSSLLFSSLLFSSLSFSFLSFSFLFFSCSLPCCRHHLSPAATAGCSLQHSALPRLSSWSAVGLHELVAHDPRRTLTLNHYTLLASHSRL